MAHFMNERGSTISKSIQRVGVGERMTIGVYGAAGLTVGPNDRSAAQIAPQGKDTSNNYWYVLTCLKIGNVMVEAKQGAAVWDYFQLVIGQTAGAHPPGAITKLSSSVGAGGRNVAADVLLVKRLLAAKMQERFTPPIAINSDGNDAVFHEAIRVFQREVLGLKGDGRVDPGGRTFSALCASSGKGAAGPAPGPNGKYTDNTKEVSTKNTKPTPQQVVAMLGEVWPELTSQGTRTLTAQFMAETGSGKYCFNWNLGNVKAGPDEPHMYLRRVWEVMSPTTAQKQVEQAGGLAYIASAQEIRTNGWSCPAGKVVVVFQPPHAQCRFRAYTSLTEGAQRWPQQRRRRTHHRWIRLDSVVQRAQHLDSAAVIGCDGLTAMSSPP